MYLIPSGEPGGKKQEREFQKKIRESKNGGEMKELWK